MCRVASGSGVGRVRSIVSLNGGNPRVRLARGVSAGVGVGCLSGPLGRVLCNPPNAKGACRAVGGTVSVVSKLARRRLRDEFSGESGLGRHFGKLLVSS